jgi:hypothetical protein
MICPECETSVSSHAVACPKCGYPISANVKPATPPAQKEFVAGNPNHVSPKALHTAPASSISKPIKIIGWTILGCGALLAAFLSIGFSIRASRSPEQNRELDIIRTCRKIVENGQFPPGACTEMESTYSAKWGDRP